VIHNPSNLYAGAAVKLDSSPYLNFAINLLAQKQAKNEATDRYFAEQAAKSTPEGLHQDEVTALAAAKNQWQQNYIKNRQAIHKGDPQALMQNYADQNLMSNIVARGKAKMADSKEAFGILKNPENADRLDEQSLQNINNSHAPIYKVGADGRVVDNTYEPQTNPTGYKPLDMSSIKFNPKDYNVNELQNYHNGFGKLITPDKEISNEVPDQKDKFHNILTTTKSYSPTSVTTLLNKGLSDYNNDDRLRETYRKNHTLDNYFQKDEKGNIVVNPAHEDEFNALDKVYQIGFPGKHISTMGDLHAAIATSQKIQPQITTTRVSNEQGLISERNAFAERMKNATFANEKALYDYKLAHPMSGGEDPLAPKISLTDEYLKQYGKTGLNPLTNQPMQYIPAEVVSPSHQKFFGKAMEFGNGQRGFPVDKDGNLIGLQVITKGKIGTGTVDKPEVPEVTQPVIINKKAVDNAYLESVGVKNSQKNMTNIKPGLGNTSSPNTQNENVKVQVNGKIFQVPKGNLQKMDKDKVPYKLLQ
jgi:hypothetical protein